MASSLGPIHKACSCSSSSSKLSDFGSDQQPEGCIDNALVPQGAESFTSENFDHELLGETLLLHAGGGGESGDPMRDSMGTPFLQGTSILTPIPACSSGLRPGAWRLVASQTVSGGRDHDVHLDNTPNIDDVHSPTSTVHFSGHNSPSPLGKQGGLLQRVTAHGADLARSFAFTTNMLHSPAASGECRGLQKTPGALSVTDEHGASNGAADDSPVINLIHDIGSTTRAPAASRTLEGLGGPEHLSVIDRRMCDQPPPLSPTHAMPTSFTRPMDADDLSSPGSCAYAEPSPQQLHSKDAASVATNPLFRERGALTPPALAMAFSQVGQRVMRPSVGASAQRSAEWSSSPGSPGTASPVQQNARFAVHTPWQALDDTAGPMVPPGLAVPVGYAAAPESSQLGKAGLPLAAADQPQDMLQRYLAALPAGSPARGGVPASPSAYPNDSPLCTTIGDDARPLIRNLLRQRQLGDTGNGHVPRLQLQPSVDNNEVALRVPQAATELGLVEAIAALVQAPAAAETGAVACAPSAPSLDGACGSRPSEQPILQAPTLETCVSSLRQELDMSGRAGFGVEQCLPISPPQRSISFSSVRTVGSAEEAHLPPQQAGKDLSAEVLHNGQATQGSCHKPPGLGLLVPASPRGNRARPGSDVSMRSPAKAARSSSMASPGASAAGTEGCDPDAQEGQLLFTAPAAESDTSKVGLQDQTPIKRSHSRHGAVYGVNTIIGLDTTHDPYSARADLKAMPTQSRPLPMPVSALESVQAQAASTRCQQPLDPPAPRAWGGRLMAWLLLLSLATVTLHSQQWWAPPSLETYELPAEPLQAWQCPARYWPAELRHTWLVSLAPASFTQQLPQQQLVIPLGVHQSERGLCVATCPLESYTTSILHVLVPGPASLQTASNGDCRWTFLPAASYAQCTATHTSTPEHLATDGNKLHPSTGLNIAELMLADLPAAEPAAPALDDGHCPLYGMLLACSCAECLPLQGLNNRDVPEDGCILCPAMGITTAQLADDSNALPAEVTGAADATPEVPATGDPAYNSQQSSDQTSSSDQLASGQHDYSMYGWSVPGICMGFLFACAAGVALAKVADRLAMMGLMSAHRDVCNLAQAALRQVATLFQATATPVTMVQQPKSPLPGASANRVRILHLKPGKHKV